MKHTPAPWTEPRIYKHPDNKPYAIAIYAKNATIHRQRVYGEHTFEEFLANAKLISSAPELLNICITISLAVALGEFPPELWEELNRVIQKAT